MTTTEPTLGWQARLAHVVETVRAMSTHTDPQTMVQDYRRRMRALLPTERIISLSRRDLAWPRYRVTRSTTWDEEPNPWKEKSRLPLLEGGLFADLIYGDEPRIIEELQVSADDPAAEYLAGQRSLVAIPHFDGGTALNMVVLTRSQPAGFDPEDLPDMVLTSNLFGRATHNLALSSQLREAYREVDHELRMIARIQRSLLPATLPQIPTMQLAAHYETSRRAGGDYYDFFALPNGRWGILIADVAGHGTPAAVLMAITHSIAHSYPGDPDRPAEFLGYLNLRLTEHYTEGSGTFVTAFHGVYDPAKCEMVYACAGHNPPRLKRCQDGSIFSLDKARSLPLGIMPDAAFEQASLTLHPGDQIVFYTDGITEATNPRGEMFGLQRLDLTLEDCSLFATGLIKSVLDAVNTFTDGHPADDDRTVLIAKIT